MMLLTKLFRRTLKLRFDWNGTKLFLQQLWESTAMHRAIIRFGVCPLSSQETNKGVVCILMWFLLSMRPAVTRTVQQSLVGRVDMLLWQQQQEDWQRSCWRCSRLRFRFGENFKNYEQTKWRTELHRRRASFTVVNGSIVRIACNQE